MTTIIMDISTNSYPAHKPPIASALVNQEAVIIEDIEKVRLSKSQTKGNEKEQKKHIATQFNAQVPLPQATQFTSQPIRTLTNLSAESLQVDSLQIGSLHPNPSTLEHIRRSENHTRVDPRDDYYEESTPGSIFAMYHNLNYDHSGFPKHL